METFYRTNCMVHVRLTFGEGVSIPTKLFTNHRAPAAEYLTSKIHNVERFSPDAIAIIFYFGMSSHVHTWSSCRLNYIKISEINNANKYAWQSIATVPKMKDFGKL
uniref:(northern house mosquito) hypothetical protein n=1 Tax=Culex pipiens TaxID=7175 RepID=A0A8D8BKE0_CULPI